MHELGIVIAAVKEVVAFAAENHIPEVSEIVLEIGEGTGVIPDYVRQVYPIAVEDTMLRDTKLIIEVVPGMAMCENCREIYNVIQCEGACPACGSREKEVLSGMDFNIKEIHVPADE